MKADWSIRKVLFLPLVMWICEGFNKTITEGSVYCALFAEAGAITNNIENNASTLNILTCKKIVISISLDDRIISYYQREWRKFNGEGWILFSFFYLFDIYTLYEKVSSFELHQLKYLIVWSSLSVLGFYLCILLLFSQIGKYFENESAYCFVVDLDITT